MASAVPRHTQCLHELLLAFPAPGSFVALTLSVTFLDTGGRDLNCVDTVHHSGMMSDAVGLM